MLHKIQPLIKVGLLSCILVTFGMSITEIPLPSVGGYWIGVSIAGRFFLFHPVEFVRFIEYSIENPEIIDWVVEHIDELSHLLENEEVLSLLMQNPWLFELIKGIYDVDPDFLLNLEIERLISLLTWAIEHPQYREILLKHPQLAIELVEGDFDETVFFSRITILYPLPSLIIHKATAVNVTAYSPEGIRSIEVRWKSTESTGIVATQLNSSSLCAIWNTTSLPSGPYTLKAVAETGNGSVVEDWVNVIVSNGLTVEIVSPKDGDTVGGNFNITVRVTSLSPIISCTANLKSSRNSYYYSLTETDENGFFLVVVDSGIVVDGDYSLKVTATGMHGSQNSSTIFIIISNFPWLRILSPSNSSTVEGDFNVTVEVGGFEPVVSCIANLTGIDSSHFLNLTDPDGDSVFCGTFNSSAIKDGSYLLRVTVVDIDGSSNSSAIALMVSSFPQLRIISPEEGDVVRGNFSVQVWVDSVDSVIGCVANLTNAQENHVLNLSDPDGDGVYVGTFNSALITDASYSLIVTATDIDGSQNSSSISITVSDAPQLRILSPQNGDTVSGNFSVSVKVWGNEVVLYCMANLTREGNSFVRALCDPDGDGVYVGYFDTITVVDGSYFVNVTATDIDGSQNSSMIAITVSNLPWLQILSPRDRDTVDGNFNVIVEVRSYRPISECKATIGGQEFVLTDADGDKIFNSAIDSTFFSDGIYTLTISVQDIMGSTNSSQITLKIDNVPDVELQQPANGVFIEGNFTITAEVTSLDAVLRVVAYDGAIILGNLSDPDGDDVYTLTLNSAMLSEYYHDISVEATDELGFFNSSLAHRIKVDNQASQVVILEPANKSICTGPYINVSASINDFTNWVRVYVNGVPVAYETYSNSYVTDVGFTIDTSDIIFYTSTTLITVGYESALGHTNSTYIIIYKVNL